MQIFANHKKRRSNISNSAKAVIGLLLLLIVFLSSFELIKVADQREKNEYLNEWLNSYTSGKIDCNELEVLDTTSNPIKI